MAARQPYNPGLLVDDEGNARQATGGLRDKFWGMEVERKFNQNRVRNWWNTDPSRRGIRPPHSDPQALLPAGWRGYRGIMRGMKNAAEVQGRNFNVDVNTWGNTKDLDVPSGLSYSRDAGEIAPGLRGRPPKAIAAMTGADPNKRGYYTPDEFEQARAGLSNAFGRLRRGYV